MSAKERDEPGGFRVRLAQRHSGRPVQEQVFAECKTQAPVQQQFPIIELVGGSAIDFANQGPALGKPPLSRHAQEIGADGKGERGAS